MGCNSPHRFWPQQQDFLGKIMIITKTTPSRHEDHPGKSTLIHQKDTAQRPIGDEAGVSSETVVEGKISLSLRERKKCSNSLLDQNFR